MVFPILGSGDSSAGYDIENSMRFDDITAHFQRTPGSAGNRRTFTISFWMKNCSAGKDTAGHHIFYVSNPSDTTTWNGLYINGAKLYFYGEASGAGHFNLATNRLFRDPSAWYHIVVAVDTTDGTTANRVKIYVNGVQETSFSTATYPSQNDDLPFNNTGPHAIAAYNPATNFPPGAGLNMFDGHLADVYMVDGTALSPTSFGKFDDSGIWKPIAYTGSYGTNGYFLEFQGARKSILGSSTASISTTGAWYSSYSVAATLIDGSFSTYIQSNNTAQTATMKFDLGSGITKTVTSYSIHWAQTNGVSSLVLSGSNDDSTYTTIDTNTSLTTKGSGSPPAVEYQTVTNSTAYRYYKLAYVQDDSDYPYILQLQMFTSNLATVGEDSSGSGNHWTIYSISGARDQTTDTPTNNFCTGNPLSNFYESAVYSEGNLTIQSDPAADDNAYTAMCATIALKAGKWYWEVHVDSVSNATEGSCFGITPYITSSKIQWVGAQPYSYGYYYNGLLYNNNSSNSFGDSFTTNDTLSFGLDLTNNKLYAAKNGVWQNSGDPAAGSNGFTIASLATVAANISATYPHIGGYQPAWSEQTDTDDSTNTWNFGNPPYVISSGNADANGYGNFEYAVPSGFYAICTKNLAEYG